jgi:hypothetical protein
MPERLLLDITRVELTDHRGVSRVVPFIDALGPPRGFPNHPGRPAMWTLRKAILRRTWLTGGLLGGTVTLIVGFVLGTLLFIPLVQRSTLNFLAGVALLLPLIILGYECFALPIFRRIYRPVFTSACLELALCPFCLYDLSKTPPAHDTCRRCPECDGAWRLARQETTAQAVEVSRTDPS